MTATLELDDLHKSYSGADAVRGVSLRLERGEIFGLLGPNGAGKSTTLGMAAGLLQPDRGRVVVDGLPLEDRRRAAQLRLSYLPENVALYPYLSGLENLDYFCRLAGIREGRNWLLARLEAVGLSAAVAMRRTATYSKGMRQKVGIAIAMAKGASCILLDEPSSGLDPSASHALSRLLTEVASEGCAVLMATHDLFRARETCGRVGLLLGGRLVDTWTADEMTATSLEAVYLQHVEDAEREAVLGGGGDSAVAESFREASR